MLENVLSHMTGRPTCIGSSSFSVEQPIPYSEDMFARPHVMDLLTNNSLRRERLRWSLEENENEEEKNLDGKNNQEENDQEEKEGDKEPPAKEKGKDASTEKNVQTKVS